MVIKIAKKKTKEKVKRERIIKKVYEVKNGQKLITLPRDIETGTYVEVIPVPEPKED